MLRGLLVFSGASGVLYYEHKYDANYGLPKSSPDDPEMDPMVIASMLHAFQINAAATRDSPSVGASGTHLSEIDVDGSRLHFCQHGESHVLVAVIVRSASISAWAGATLASELLQRFIARFSSVKPDKLTMKKCRKFSHELESAVIALPHLALQRALSTEEDLSWAYCGYAADLSREIDMDSACQRTSLHLELLDVMKTGSGDPPAHASEKVVCEERDIEGPVPLHRPKRSWWQCFGDSPWEKQPDSPALGQFEVAIKLGHPSATEFDTSHFFAVVRRAAKLLASIMHVGDTLQSMEVGFSTSQGKGDPSGEKAVTSKMLIIRHRELFFGVLITNASASGRVYELSHAVAPALQDAHAAFDFIASHEVDQTDAT